MQRFAFLLFSDSFEAKIAACPDGPFEPSPRTPQKLTLTLARGFVPQKPHKHHQAMLRPTFALAWTKFSNSESRGTCDTQKSERQMKKNKKKIITFNEKTIVDIVYGKIASCIACNWGWRPFKAEFIYSLVA